MATTPNIKVPTHTYGGMFGHWLRRGFHVCMIALPFLYYHYGLAIAHLFKTNPSLLLWALLAILLILETLRLKFSWDIIGQRPYEKKQISSFTWALAASFFVLLFAPDSAYAFPIIAGFALGDPLIGELRRFRVQTKGIILISILFIAGLWLLTAYLTEISYWWACIMPPITVAAEWMNLSWIDDDALMQLVPLGLVLIAHYLQVL